MSTITHHVVDGIVRLTEDEARLISPLVSKGEKCIVQFGLISRTCRQCILDVAIAGEIGVVLREQNIWHEMAHIKGERCATLLAVIHGAEYRATKEIEQWGYGSGPGYGERVENAYMEDGHVVVVTDTTVVHLHMEGGGVWVSSFGGIDDSQFLPIFEDSIEESNPQRMENMNVTFGDTVGAVIRAKQDSR